MTLSIDGIFSTDTGSLIIGNLPSPVAPALPEYSAITLQYIIDNPTPAAYEQYGIKLDVSATQIITGSHRDTFNAGAGSAYIHDVATGTLQHTLNNPEPIDNDFFGYAVAIDGDYAVVGVPFYDKPWVDNITLFNNGRVDIYNSATGVVIHTIYSPLEVAYEYFGDSVAISGDWVVIGAYGNDFGASGAGSVYVYSASTGNLIHTIHNPFPVSGDSFGDYVATDGIHITVGTPREDTGASAAGTSYTFNITTGALVHTMYNPFPNSNDLFGSVVAVDGDFAVVAAELNDDGASDTGSVYVYSTITGNLLHTIDNPTPNSSDKFGNAVAISGNYIVIGEYGLNNTFRSEGAAHVYNATTGALLVSIPNPSPAQYDSFGWGVGIHGDTVIVDSTDNTLGTDVGAVYVYKLT